MVRFHFSSGSCTTENLNFYSAQPNKKHEREKATIFFFSFTLVPSKDQILQSTWTELDFFFLTQVVPLILMQSLAEQGYSKRRRVAVQLCMITNPLTRSLKMRKAALSEVGSDRAMQNCYSSWWPMLRANRFLYQVKLQINIRNSVWQHELEEKFNLVLIFFLLLSNWESFLTDTRCRIYKLSLELCHAWQNLLWILPLLISCSKIAPV